MSDKWFVNKRSVFIVIAFGLLLTAIFYIRYGSIIKPVVFTAVLLSLFILYSILFETQKTATKAPEPEFKEVKEVKKANSEKGKIQDIELLASRINKSIKTVKLKSKDKVRLKIVSKFMDELNEFEGVIPQIIDDYKRGQDFIRKNAMLSQEIEEAQRKIDSSKGNAREIYQKSLNEKRAALDELEGIKNSLEEGESRLYYILSTLQKIEAIIEASELNEGLSDEDTQSLNAQLETFSESLKDVIGSMKL